jgi:phosphatidylserine/phosphatidylglycerophosphate/cardiolipin synthase-like enzyme
VRLLIQPDDGSAPVVSAIKGARKSIFVTIFRFDRPAIEKALEGAVARGVAVHALIAHTNAGGEKPLRKLELRLLNAGLRVSRTDDDLIRYHDKMMVVDNERLYVFGFNFTRLDMEASRSFGAVTKDRKLVQEGVKLFEADAQRQPYSPGHPLLVVSPETSRERLSAFIRKAQKQLLIYDPKLSDPAMIRILVDRVKAGVDVRVIGRVGKGGAVITQSKLPKLRLHVRAIIRDGRRAFMGSQSLRKLELDGRREVGIIIKDQPLVKKMAAVFEHDWALTDAAREAAKAERKGEQEAAAAAAR